MSNAGSRKVSLVGTGLVGSSFAYALMIRGLASELVLIDVDAGKATGEMMDFNHGLSFTRPMKITAGNYAIGLGLVSIVAAILGDYRRVVSVSTLMTGQHGVKEMCLSLPCVVGAHGVEEILTLNLDPAEEAGFRASAAKLKSTLELLDPA